MQQYIYSFNAKGVLVTQISCFKPPAPYAHVHLHIGNWRKITWWILFEWRGQRAKGMPLFTNPFFAPICKSSVIRFTKTTAACKYSEWKLLVARLYYAYQKGWLWIERSILRACATFKNAFISYMLRVKENKRLTIGKVETPLRFFTTWLTHIAIYV